MLKKLYFFGLIFMFLYQQKKRRTSLTALLVLLFFCNRIHAQQYNFTNLSVSEGLIQSQASAFCEDSYQRLWIGTYGGISRFDGKRFTNYNQVDGLVGNFVTTLFADQKKNIWIGTQIGLSMFNGKRFTNFFFPGNFNENNVFTIQEDRKGTIWVVSGHQLYHIEKNTVIKETVEKIPFHMCTAIATDPQGNLYAALYKQGIFMKSAQGWVKRIALPAKDSNIIIRKIYFQKDDPGQVLILHTGGIIFTRNNVVVPYEEPALKGIEGIWKVLQRDASGALWIVTSKGLYHISEHKLLHYTSENGFTDNSVTDIFRDHENNLWISTDGAGIYRYSFGSFRFFDHMQGLTNTVVMGITKDNNSHIVMGTYGSGLFVVEGSSLKNIRMPSANENSQRVSGFLKNADGSFWVCTDGGGLWNYRSGKVTRADNRVNRLPPTANEMIRDMQGTIWIATPVGCFYFQNGKATVNILNTFCSSIMEYGKDSIIVGTQRGLYWVINKKTIIKIADPVTCNSHILSIKKRNDSLFIATADKGIVIWNGKQQSIGNLNSKNGLNSDFVYSLLMDKDNSIWTGTGHGINRLYFSNRSFHIDNYGEQHAITASECNQNAIFLDSATNDVWIGTTKGAVVYSKNHVPDQKIPPGIVFEGVKLFSKDLLPGKYTDSIANWYNIPQKLRLPYDQNHLTFTFGSNSFKSAADVMYQYRLVGLNDRFSELSNVPFVVYPGLPPGIYTFEVRSFLPNNQYSKNTETFSFEIMPPFYQTWPFRLLFVFALVLSGILIQMQLVKWREKKQDRLYLIRKEEQNKVRRKTAEDFHDEMGNKLTRISILTDILKSKITGQDAEIKRIADQIKENSQELYSGTNDIIWSLNPDSDNLFEILQRLNDFGGNLFQDTDTHFSFDMLKPALSEIRLPIDFSRNIIMIFKEAMHNALKHAGSTTVDISTHVISDDVQITLTDNGKGFDVTNAKRGHGINNMQIRARRISATLTIVPQKGGGTLIRLQFKIPQLK